MAAEEHVTDDNQHDASSVDEELTDDLAPAAGESDESEETKASEAIVATQQDGDGEDEQPEVIDVAPVPNSPTFEAQSFVESVTAAEHDLADKKRLYDKRVSNARSALKRAQARHEQDVRRAEKDLAHIIASYSARVAAFSGVTLYLDRITYCEQELPLATDLEAYCDVQGGIRSAPARDRGGRELAKSDSVVDERDLILYIHSGASSIEVHCNPDKGDDAAKFVQRVLSTAAGIDERTNERERRVAHAQQVLEEVEADHSEIEEATRVLVETKRQTHDVDEAQARLDDLENNATEVESAVLRDSRRHARNRRLLVYVLLALVIVVTVILLVSCGGVR